MAKRYKQDSWLDLFWDIGSIVLGLFMVYMFFLYFLNRNRFNQWLKYLIVIGIGILLAKIAKGFLENIQYRKREKLAKEHKAKLLEIIQSTGQIEYLNNFINRFGASTKKGWDYRGYSFDWDRLDDLLYILNKRGISVSREDLFFILEYLIDKKEQKVTEESISLKPQLFANLDSADFEKLLYRLFEAMDYKVEHVGHPKDQGADLILNRGAERIVAQAKRFIDTPVGNKAVQEAVAARNYYNCNGTIVATSSNFTKEAIDLAKANNVYLIDRKELQDLLLKYLKEYWA